MSQVPLGSRAHGISLYLPLGQLRFLSLQYTVSRWFKHIMHDIGSSHPYAIIQTVQREMKLKKKTTKRKEKKKYKQKPQNATK